MKLLDMLNNGILILGIIFCLLVACSRKKDNRAYEYLPEMYKSTALQSYSTNRFFNDENGMQIPPENSMPLRFEKYPYSKEERKKAGLEIFNPLLKSKENSAKGKELYRSNCVFCHGAKADGKGELFTSGKYLYAPKSLVNESMIVVSDGEIYHVISEGFNMMKGQKSILLPNDRWKLVCYVRSLQLEIIK